MSRPHFYLASPDRDVNAVLAYCHKRANDFTTRAEALTVARDVLHIDRGTVWYSDSRGYQRKAGDVAEMLAAATAEVQS